MSRTLLLHAFGSIELPVKVLCDRADGGHLVVNPPRPVWERTALDADELVAWSLLVAATGQAMLDTLPALRDGCLNYWEAGNWALNDAAPPKGKKKRAPDYRRVHMHVFGRSPQAKHPSWRWGEAPRLPDYKDRQKWAKDFAPLTAKECSAIIKQAKHILRRRYA